jgi:hypothetical protein
MSEIKKDPLEPYNTATEEVKDIMKRVLKAEKEKIYQDRPRVWEDVVRIIKEAIK